MSTHLGNILPHSLDYCVCSYSSVWTVIIPSSMSVFSSPFHRHPEVYSGFLLSCKHQAKRWRPFNRHYMRRRHSSLVAHFAGCPLICTIIHDITLITLHTPVHLFSFYCQTTRRNDFIQQKVVLASSRSKLAVCLLDMNVRVFPTILVCSKYIGFKYYLNTRLRFIPRWTNDVCER